MQWSDWNIKNQTKAVFPLRSVALRWLTLFVGIGGAPLSLFHSHYLFRIGFCQNWRVVFRSVCFLRHCSWGFLLAWGGMRFRRCVSLKSGEVALVESSQIYVLASSFSGITVSLLKSKSKCAGSSVVLWKLSELALALSGLFWYGSPFPAWSPFPAG